MARVLVTSPALLGHVHPMVPLAQALAGRDHEVLWALPSNGLDEVNRRGIAAVAVAAPLPIGPALAMERYPELTSLAAEARLDMVFAKLFGAILAPEMLKGLDPVFNEWRPDLVIADAAEFAGHILAAEFGVPSITKGFGPLLPESKSVAAAVEVAELWRSRGLDPRAYGGAYDTLYVDDYPPMLQPQNHHHVPYRQLVRPRRDEGDLGPNASAPLPVARTKAPLVYVTMGTLFNDLPPLQIVLGGLEVLNVRVIVTVGPDVDPSVLGPQPAHVRVERYVPQSALFEHCDLVICHGGSGTTIGALAFGLPVLCLPQGADQFLNAAAITAIGAGLAVSPGQLSTKAVADAASQLLGQRSFREEAERVRTAIFEMPAVEELVLVLEALM
jgi:UDP:flavonoid glycosyltransferase YjiC (YdhE family)